VVVGRMFIGNQLSRAMGVQILSHVVPLGFHIGTHLVKSRGRDEVALSVNLPRDGSKLRADLVVTRFTGGGTSVHGHVFSHVSINNHAAHEVRVVVALVVDDGKDLRLDSNLLGSVGEDTITTEDTIVERGLVLIDGSAGSSSRVRPVDFVGLSNFHVFAVLPVVLRGESRIAVVVKLALESLTNNTSKTTLLIHVRGTGTGLIVLTGRVVLGTEMPVNIDRAQAGFVVRNGDGDGGGVSGSIVSLGDVGTSLFSRLVDGVNHAVDVWGIRLLARTRVGASRRTSRIEHHGRGSGGCCTGVGGSDETVSGAPVDSSKSDRGSKEASSKNSKDKCRETRCLQSFAVVVKLGRGSLRLNSRGNRSLVLGNCWGRSRELFLWEDNWANHPKHHTRVEVMRK
jgi:hypothetical protein